jgi:D-alanyl-lipoteichoic acid acyltransferase DltB (MBOAT superfamily)
MVVFAGLALVGNKILLRNAFLMFCGLFFYFKTSTFFVFILIFAIVFNFFFAKLIINQNSTTKRRIFLIINLIINILVLCYFKYSYFFIDVINNIFKTDLKVIDIFTQIGNVLAGKERFDVSKIVLPIGISFFTFQNISYIIEVFRKKVEPITNILNYGFFVSFFPSLMSGPIIRANEFIPQIYKPYFLSKKQFGIAVFWILNGLTKKIVLSDFIAVNFVDRVFENPTMFSGFENLMGLFCYSLQIYADFSGYTDIATGVAMLMGFYLPINFKSPYKATNAGQFWKCWHISLSKWLQKYLYIPLGGNRNDTFGTYCVIVTIACVATLLSSSIWVGGTIVAATAVVFLRIKFQKGQKKKIITNLNMMNTMLLGGLWHGASWNFIIWGGLNGVGMLIYKYWKDKPIKDKTLILLCVTFILGVLLWRFQSPIMRIGLVWLAVLLGGTSIRFIFSKTNTIYSSAISNHLSNGWAVFQTFVFITFTRLFFRSGSNLNPDDANLHAWNTAKNMVNQIGGQWDFRLIPQMLYEYRNIFILFVLGMIIHWLPEHFKRRYRLWFASMPMWLMALGCVFVIFVLYQFITADLQRFIYFQF